LNKLFFNVSRKQQQQQKQKQNKTKQTEEKKFIFFPESISPFSFSNFVIV